MPSAEAVDQVHPPADPGGVEVGGEVDLADPVAFGRVLGVEQPGVGRPAEEAGVLARPDAAVGVEDPVRQGDRGRQGPAGRLDLRPTRAPRLGESLGAPGLAFSTFWGECGRPVSM